MKRDLRVVVAAALVIGAAAVFAMKRGGGGGGGKCGGGACCPVIPGLNVWSTSLPAGTNAVNTNSAVTLSETITNRQR